MEKNKGGNKKDNFSKNKAKFVKFVHSLRNNSSNKSIAEEHSVSAFTVSYWRIKLGIPRALLSQEPSKAEKLPPKTYARDGKLYRESSFYMNGEKYKAPKSYAEYLKEDQDRKKKKAEEELSTLLKKGG